MGSFLARAHHGNIFRRDRVKFEKASQQFDNDHAFRAVAAYATWLLTAGEAGARELAVLRLTGLFDRPADAGCVKALLAEPIAGLNEPLVGLGEDEWETTLSDLAAEKAAHRGARQRRRAALARRPSAVEGVFRQGAEGKQSGGLEGGAQAPLRPPLRQRRGSGKAAPTMDDLRPLYQAVAHGCHAGCAAGGVRGGVIAIAFCAAMKSAARKSSAP